MVKQSPITFASGKLVLEGVLQLPEEGQDFPAMLVCHPHPLYSGDMENNVVLALCEATTSARMASLRFNLRGVGASQGSYTGGEGEREDALAALGYLKSHPRISRVSIGIAGYSFGAGTALEVAEREVDLRAIIVVGCSASALERPGLRQNPRPTLVIAGERDRIAQLDQLHSAAQRVPGPVEICILPGADHFFRGHEAAITSHASEFLNRWLK